MTQIKQNKEPISQPVVTTSTPSAQSTTSYQQSPHSLENLAIHHAQGADIHVGPDQGKHLPHEAWHVVQQTQGRVQPTIEK